MRHINAIIEIINGIAKAHRIQFVSVAVIVVAAILLLLSFAASEDRKTVFGPQLGADYANFYIAGTILNSAEPGRLYDLRLQSQLYHELLPQAPPDTILPYPYAPFFAVFCRPFALLPYEWSYFAWLAVGLVAYVVGFLLVWKASPKLDNVSLPAALLVALSFMPFVFDGWIGGQSVGIIILVIGVAVFCHSRQREALGGFTLAFCLFKPTILVLIVPMLIFTRRYKALAGFFSGAAVMYGFSWLTVGQKGLTDYTRLLLIYAKVKNIAPEAFRTFKYVDVTSFMRLLTPNQTTLSVLVPVAVSVVILLVLIYFWWTSDGKWTPMGQLSWATALAWTPVLSPQCAIYDVTLLVPSVLLMASALKCCEPGFVAQPNEALRALVVLLYLTAWFTQSVAVASGIQVISLVLGAIGGYALWMERKLATPRLEGLDLPSAI